eukprot:gene6750-8369_t
MNHQLSLKVGREIDYEDHINKRFNPTDPLVKVQYFSKLPEYVIDKIICLEIVYNSFTPPSIFSLISQCKNLETIKIHGVLEPGSIPSTIQNLKLHHLFFREDPLNIIPSSVTDLTIYTFSPKPNDNSPIVPNSIRKLNICTYNNDKQYVWIEIGNLPNSITHLDIQLELIRLKPGAIPSSVKKLNLGRLNSGMNLEPGIIPLGVEKLIFRGHGSNCCFPQRKNFRGILERGCIPETVTDIKSPHFKGPFLISGIYPEMLTKIITTESITSESRLPPFLEHLECGIKILKIVTISSHYYPLIPIGGLPESTEYLSLGKEFGQPLSEGILPSKLQTLELGDSSNQPKNIKMDLGN